MNRWRRLCKSVSTPCGVLPRRFISSRVAVCREYSSVSLKCFKALDRFLGRTCRCGSLSVVGFGAGDAEAVEVGNKSGAVRSVWSRAMASGCHRTVWVGNQHRVKMVVPGGTCASDTWRTGSPPQRKSSFDVCGAKGVSLCLPQRRRKIVLAREVFYTLGIRRKARKRFETTMAFRAMPKMSNKLMIQVFGPFRRDQFVAALDAIDSE